MENKKGSIPTVFLVVMTFVIVGAALFSFYKNANEVKTELIDVYFLNKIYSDEFKIESELNQILENQIIQNYGYAIREDGEDAASKLIIDKFKEKVKNYDFKQYDIKYRNGEFYFYGELNQPMTGCFDNDQKWKWGDFSDKKECNLGVIYRPNINFNLKVKSLDIIEFEDYFLIVNDCKYSKEVLSCLKSKISEFDITYDEKNKKATFTSKQFYFISGKLMKITFELEFT